MNPYGMWISPKGNIWDVPNLMGHEDIAAQITGDLFEIIDEQLPHSRYLLSSGFVRFIYERDSISVNSYRKLTKSQKEIIEYEKEKVSGCTIELDEYSFLDFICHAHYHYNFVPLREFIEKV